MTGPSPSYTSGCVTRDRSGAEVTVVTTARSDVRLRDCAGGGRANLPITFHLSWPGVPVGWHAAAESLKLGEVATFEMSLADACGPEDGPFRTLLEAPSGATATLELELTARTEPVRLRDAAGEAAELPEDAARLWIRRRKLSEERPRSHSRVRFHLRVHGAPHGSLARDCPWVQRGAPLLDTKATGERASFALGGSAAPRGLLERTLRAMCLGDSARLLLEAGAFAAGREPDAAAPEQLRRLLASWQGPLELQILGLSENGDPPQKQVSFSRAPAVSDRGQQEDIDRRICQTFAEIRAVCQEGSSHTRSGDARSATVCYKRGFELARSLSSLEQATLDLPSGAAAAATLARARKVWQLKTFTALAAMRLRSQQDASPQASLEEVLEEAEKELGLEPKEAKVYRQHATARLAGGGPAAAAKGPEAPASTLQPSGAATPPEPPCQPTGVAWATPTGAAALPVLLSYSPGDEGVPLKFPSPLVTQGLSRIDEAARRVAVGVEDKGISAYKDEMLRETRRAVELQFGPVAGSRLKRLGPCIAMIAQQEQLQGYEPGMGRRQMSSYIAGLEPQRPFHETEDYPWCSSLAEGTETLLEELRKHEGAEELWTSGNRDAPEWRSIVLVKRGLWVAKRDVFQRTKALFMSLQGVRPMEVCLAKMPPHSKIQPHSDNSNFLLTAHLGLEVSEGCQLRVGEWTREWKPGKALVFDHSYIHSAVNESERDRYVLVFRFYHPDCRDEECYALSYLALLLESIMRDGRVAAVFEDPLRPLRQRSRFRPGDTQVKAEHKIGRPGSRLLN